MILDSSVAAIVTGGASGLGLATVAALRAHGARVAIFDANRELGERAATATGALFCPVDIRDEANVDAGFRQARDVNGQERVLINCAGLGSGVRTAARSRAGKEIRHFPIELFDMVIQVNLIGTFRCIAKAAAGMMTLDPLPGGERGAIVNTASTAAEDGQTTQAAYSASKAGIVGMTLPIARDLASEGIRINTILPGLFDTPVIASAPQAVRDVLDHIVPFPPRLGDAREFASLALHLVTNAFFNGEDVRLDGALRVGPSLI